MALNESHDWLNMTDPDHVQEELGQTDNDLNEVSTAIKTVRTNLTNWTHTAVQLDEQAGHLPFAITEIDRLATEMPQIWQIRLTTRKFKLMKTYVLKLIRHE